jgi:hypothetical protein
MFVTLTWVIACATHHAQAAFDELKANRDELQQYNARLETERDELQVLVGVVCG